MYPVASTINGVGITQRLGHHDRRLIQIVEPQVLAHTLKRMHGP